MKRQTQPTIQAHLLRSAFVLLLAVCVIPFALGQRAARKHVAPTGTCPNLWEEVAPMPIDLAAAACASDGTFVYCGGGNSLSQGTTLAVFNRYDPVANTWTSLPDMPQAAIMGTAVYYPTTNRIYIFGGEDPATGTNYNITRIYDIAGNTWTTGANMPDVRSFSAGGYSPATGKIYIISGYNTGTVDSAQPNTWEYDPVMDTWTDLTGTAPFPHPAGGFAYGVINDKLYIAGGRDYANVVLNLNWEYDPVANLYTARANEPVQDGNNVPGSGVALNVLWVFGGGDPDAGAGKTKITSKAAFPGAAITTELVQGKKPLIPATDNTTRFYDPSTDSWGSFSSMNEVRSFPGGAAIGNMLVAAGGFNRDLFVTLSSVETVAACIPTPTPPQCDTGLMQNEGFETGAFPPWVVQDTNALPVVTNTWSHSGTFSAFLGDAPDGFCGFPETETTGDSSFYQEFGPVPANATLSFWHWDCSTDVSIIDDWQDAYITDTEGNILQTIFHELSNTETWINTTVSLAPYEGQTIRIKFLVHEDGFGDLTGMYVDDVHVTVPCGSPTPTPTSTPTPTCPAAWAEVAPMPVDLFGAAGASDGTYFYAAGGYSSIRGTTLAVFNRYDPVANTWTSLPDMPQAAFMAVPVYYPPTNKIYIFGGEDAATGTNYNITRIYDIAGNTWTTGANMPDVRSFSAGGYSPATGKIYIISGYNTGTVDSAQPNTWEYDPVMDTWTDLTGTAPFPHPAGGFAYGVINDKLYIAGGRDANNADINLNWEYDPVAHTYTPKANMPWFQPNVPGSAVALDALFVFGGGDPFLVAGAVATRAPFSVSQAALGLTKLTFAGNKTLGGSRQIASSLTTAVFPIARGGSALKDKSLVPLTTNATYVYDPANDRWTTSRNMNETRSFTSGAFISGSNEIIAAGGSNGFETLASAEVLTPCIQPPACNTDAIQNEGFESGDFTGWVIQDTNAAPVVTNSNVHSGSYSAFVGDAPDGFCGSGAEASGDSSFYQQFTVPDGISTLSFWYWACTTDNINFDWQDAYVTDTDGNILLTIFHQCYNHQVWVNQAVDMTPYAGQTVRIKFLVHEDGVGDLTGMYVDDVQLTVPCGSPTPTPTATPRPTPTPRPRPTPAHRPTPPR